VPHAEVDLIDPQHIRLYLDEFADLVLEIEGKEVERGVCLTRCFPISAGERFIALRTHRGEELGIVRDVTELDAQSQQALRAELERSYFRPQITRVHAITERFHVPRWEVETDRGPRVFEIRSTRRDLRVLGGGRVLIRDADGNLYEIPDHRRLDPQSHAIVEEHI
jgi:hypothetical protein